MQRYPVGGLITAGVVFVAWVATGQTDYMRFYMGTIWICGRADLGVVYRKIMIITPWETARY